MSYSFSVRAPNKQEACHQVAQEMIKVLKTQEIHARDCLQAVQAANLFIGLLDEDPNSDVTVTVSGSLSWDTPDVKIRWASVNISAAMRLKAEK